MQHALLLLLLLIAKCLSACTLEPSGVELGISAGELWSGATFAKMGEFVTRDPPITSFCRTTSQDVTTRPKQLK